LTHFVYACNGAPDVMLRGSESFRIVKDHLGSVRLVVDADTGEVLQELRYGPFGEVLVDTNPGFQPFGFAGGLYDPDTGLVRFGARDYDPEVGRWTSKDPIGLSGGVNVYVYAANDPVNLVDTTGNCPEGQTPRFLGPTGTPLCVSAEQAQWMDAGHGASAAATVLLAAPKIAAAIVAAARWLGLAGAKRGAARAAPKAIDPNKRSEEH